MQYCLCLWEDAFAQYSVHVMAVTLLFKFPLTFSVIFSYLALTPDVLLCTAAVALTLPSVLPLADTMLCAMCIINVARVLVHTALIIIGFSHYPSKYGWNEFNEVLSTMI